MSDDELPPRTHLGSLFRRSQQLHSQMWSSDVSDDVTSPQAAVLLAIYVGGEVDLRTVGANASLDRSTLSAVVDRLIRRHYVQRRRDPNDARKHLLVLTEQGRAVSAELQRRSELLNRRLRGLLGDEESAQLVSLLQRFVALARDAAARDSSPAESVSR
ncbi:MAG TPA: MarR family winged helix-turn-helix transcriptional regulator [Acidimicrobiales bacterium]